MPGQTGSRPVQDGYEYYQYDNSEFLEYMEENHEQEPDRIYNHNEDEEGIFERVPLETTLINTVKKTARFPEEVLKRLERSVTQKYLKLNLLDLKLKDLQEYIIPFLKQFPDIKCLAISGNNLEDAAINALKELNLGALDISVNKLTDIGAGLIAQKMQLKFLDISNNNIGDNGAVALAKCFSIKKLDIYHNGLITKAGQAEIMSMVNERNLGTLQIGGEYQSQVLLGQIKPVSLEINTFALADIRHLAQTTPGSSPEKDKDQRYNESLNNSPTLFAKEGQDSSPLHPAIGSGSDEDSGSAQEETSPTDLLPIYGAIKRKPLALNIEQNKAKKEHQGDAGFRPKSW